MGKTPKPLLPLAQQCLGPPHAPPQTAAPTVYALSHSYAASYSPQNYPFPLTDPQTPLAASSLDQSDLPSVHPFFHSPLADRQTNRWSAGNVCECDYRPLTLYRQQRGLFKVEGCSTCIAMPKFNLFRVFTLSHRAAIRFFVSSTYYSRDEQLLSVCMRYSVACVLSLRLPGSSLRQC